MAAPIRRIDKGWGHELIWAEGPGYCGKILHFARAGSRCSLHFHRTKHETWLVTRGGFDLVSLATETAERRQRTLGEGDVWTNPPGLPHQLVALVDGAEVVEVSSPDDPADNFRVEPGDSQR